MYIYEPCWIFMKFRSKKNVDVKETDKPAKDSRQLLLSRRLLLTVQPLNTAPRLALQLDLLMTNKLLVSNGTLFVTENTGDYIVNAKFRT